MTPVQTAMFAVGAIVSLTAPTIHSVEVSRPAAIRQAALAQGDAAQIQQWTSALAATDPVERASAACQLGERGERADAAIPGLVHLLADATVLSQFQCPSDRSNHEPFNKNDTTVGEIAAVALARINGPAVDALIGATRGRSAVTRVNAAFGLGLAGSSKAVEPLVAALRDEEPTVREKAAWSLGLQGDERSVEPLAKALGDPREGVRCQAAWALGLKGDERSVEPLTRALDDRSARVRAQAAWALGLKGDERAIDGLVRRLTDDDSAVASQAAWALGLKGDARALEPLAGALKSPSADVRKQAVWAISMLGMRNGGGPHPQPHPRPHPNLSVRKPQHDSR
jgi:HEAT repeat protein